MVDCSFAWNKPSVHICMLTRAPVPIFPQENSSCKTIAGNPQYKFPSTIEQRRFAAQLAPHSGISEMSQICALNSKLNRSGHDSACVYDTRDSQEKSSALPLKSRSSKSLSYVDLEPMVGKEDEWLWAKFTDGLEVTSSIERSADSWRR